MENPVFDEEQIALALHRAETGTPVETICRDLGIRQETFNHWKERFSGLSVSELHRYTQLERKAARLSRLISRLNKVTLLAIFVVAIYGIYTALKL